MDERQGIRRKVRNFGLSIAAIGLLTFLCIAAVEERIRTGTWPT